MEEVGCDLYFKFCSLTSLFSSSIKMGYVDFYYSQVFIDFLVQWGNSEEE